MLFESYLSYPLRSEVLMSRGDVLREDGLAVDEHISVQDERYNVKTCGVLERENSLC